MFVRLCFLDVFSRSNLFLETSLQWRTALLTAVGSMLINWQQAQRMQTQSRQQNFLTIVSLSFLSTASCHKHLFFKAYRNAEARVHETYLWIIWTRQSLSKNDSCCTSTSVYHDWFVCRTQLEHWAWSVHNDTMLDRNTVTVGDWLTRLNTGSASKDSSL